MNDSLVLSEAIEKIKKATKNCLDCDKARLFIVDQEKEELYTKIQKG